MNGSGVVQPVGEGAVGVLLHDMPGGNQPPLQHVPPPSAANGSGVVHDVGLVGAGADVEVVDVEVVDVEVDVVAVRQTIPGGNQPPLQHVPPPSATKGSGVAHDVGLVGAGADVEVVDVEVDVVAARQTIPGGNQPPLQHVPPPSATNGSGVEHVLAVGAGVGVGVGAARMVVDTSFEGLLVAPFASYATTAKYQVPSASDATV